MLATDAHSNSQVFDPVPVNTAFGILCGLTIVRRSFPGKGLLNAFIDLPLALSPVVVGLALFLLFL
jgi:sulfate transport system permease protein